MLGGPGFVAPSERVAVAIIGAGGMGTSNAKSLLAEPEAQIVAVCDVAERTDLKAFWYRYEAGRKPVKALVEAHYGKASPNYRCADYEDFRVMLEKEKGIDAILCATPDHLHAFVSTVAMRMGKHVYCEKPLGHSVWEVRQMARVAKETGVATQMGNHGHSGAGIRMTCEWIWDGAIGPVREVHAWSDAGRWDWLRKSPGRPVETPPVPAGFNWDLWLGPFRYGPAYPFNAMEPDLEASELPLPPMYLTLNYRHSAAKNESLTLQIELLAPMAESFMSGGDTFLMMAAAETDATRRDNARRLGWHGQYMARCCLTARNVKAAVIAERAKDRAKVVEIARAEYENAKAALKLLHADSRLGWEPTMLYRGGPDMVEWKLRYMEQHYAVGNR